MIFVWISPRQSVSKNIVSTPKFLPKLFLCRSERLSGHSKLAHYVVPILIMLVPLLDTTIVSVSRIATGTPVSRRGLDHSHHRLLALGLSDERAAALCWSLATVAGTCAVLIALMPYPYLVATLPLMLAVFGLVGLFMIDLTFDSNSPNVVHGYLRGMARLLVAWTYKRRIAEAWRTVMTEMTCTKSG